MSDSNKAVFLSYASQDSDAAKRICEALRSSGIEVWFDQSELVGGDAWDQKIRKQIKECALFVPVISASTQARREGYFRIEWRLAAQRTHAIAEGTPFLLPIVIDETPEPAALVPVEFRDVQWTRLSVKETPESLAVRIDRLLQRTDGSSEPAPEARGLKAEGGRKPQRRLSPGWLAVLIPVGVTLLALGAVAVKKFRDGGSKSVAVAPVTEVEQLVAQGYAILNNFGYRRDDLMVAEDFLRRATEQAPGSTRAWAARAYVNSLYLLRDWDRSEKRAQDTQTFANRALALDPNNTEAMLALAYLFNRQRAFVQVEALMRTAMGLRTDDPRLPRALGVALSNQQRLDEAVTILQDAVRRFPRDALVHYELGLTYRLDPDAALAEFEAALAIRPFASALLQKAIYLANYKGELGTARSTLDQIETRDRAEDRAVGVAMWVGLLERDPGRVIAAAGLTARTYLDDTLGFANGPKAILLALVHQLAGKEAVARRYWQEAETSLRQHLSEAANDLGAQAQLAICLARLGRGDEAEMIANRVEAILQEQPAGGLMMVMAYYHAGRGDAVKALAFARHPSTRRAFFSDRLLALNPWFDPIRGQPEFERAVADAADQRSGVAGGSQTVDSRQGTVKAGSAFNPEPRTQNPEPASGVNLDPKSVAVLAFANLSDDKDNEYFSDGISEELLTVLQKIPGMRVAARTSAFSFKGSKATAQEIGQKLGVVHLVEGSVRRAGNSVRIAARLSRADTGEQLWSESYTRELKDVFAVQSELAQTIVEQLGSRLGGGPARAEIQAQVQAAIKGGTRNAEAHQLYLQGKFFANQFSMENLARAADLFQQAIDRDANFALAWAALGRVSATRAEYDTAAAGTTADFARARAAADRALALEPGLAEGYSARLEVQASYDFDWRGARESARRALELAPADALVVHNAARLAGFFGDLEKSVELGRQAVALDPVNPEIHHYFAGNLSELGRFAEAEPEHRRALELSPSLPLGHYMIAMDWLEQGRAAEARVEAEKEQTDWGRATALAMIHWTLKNPAAADAELARLVASFADVCAYQIAQVHAYRRDNDRAFEWLERAYRQRDPGLAFSKRDRQLANLQADPRWPAFLRKLGLADEQLK